jgi:TonB family protein
MKRGALATLLALVGHAVFVALLLFLSLLKLNVPDGAHKKSPARPVVLRGLSPQQWASNRGEPQPNVHDERLAKNQTPVPEKKKKDESDPKPKGQVVDVAPGNNEVDPNAKYLAESNNATKKESKAKEQTAFYRNAMPKRTSPNPHEGDGSDAVDKAQAAGNHGIGQDDRPLREASQRKQVFEVPDQKARSEVAMREKTEGPGANISNRTESEQVQGNSTRLKILPGSGSMEDGSQGRQGDPGAANLLPSPAVLDKISGAAANDHLADIDEGEGTFLNTKEWKYASFFNRVKQSVGMRWNPNALLRQRDPTGNIYGGHDRYTLLNVTLTDRGNVKEIYVEKSCGVDFLDVEAIQSFERAQPFPNPPPGLVNNDSNVNFLFGFSLEMSGTPRMRLFRSAN